MLPRGGRAVTAALACSALAAQVRPSMAAAFTCPVAGLEMWSENAAGVRGRTVWRGADPKDPDVCLVETGAARKTGVLERKLFGYWKQAEVILTASEDVAFRRSMGEVLGGGASSAQFIMRLNGEQVVQQWHVAETEDIVINGQAVRTIRLRVNYTHSANTSQWYRDFWFAPALHMFVRSKPSLDYMYSGVDNMNLFTWSVVKISEKQKPE